MISNNDVKAAYRFILGREPESEQVVEDLANCHDTIATLRDDFLRSDEFTSRDVDVFAKTPRLSPTSFSPPRFTQGRLAIDLDVAPETLAAMLRRVEATWEALGQHDPFWSVVTEDRYRTAAIANDQAAFFETGQQEVQAFQMAADRAGADLAALDTCLEFGCGVGRVTHALAPLFRTVLACDISRHHLRLAETTLAERQATGVALIHTGSMEALATLPRFDVLFSIIVLQHNPPPVAAFILGCLLDKLNPGGIAYVQVPIYRVCYAFDAAAYLQSEAGVPRMEMHVLPQHMLFKLFAEHNCQVLDVREDEMTGSGEFLSNTFLVQKSGLLQEWALANAPAP